MKREANEKSKLTIEPEKVPTHNIRMILESPIFVRIENDEGFGCPEIER